MANCSMGLCKNNRRKNPTLRFIPFVKPFGRFADKERAKRWVHLCGRKDLTVDKITHSSFICAHHFPNYEEKKDFNPILNKELEPYNYFSSKHPKFVKTKGNTVKKKPVIPPDLHDVSPENNLENVNKTYTKPKVTIVTIPYGVAKEVTENIDVRKVDPKSLLELNTIEVENPWKVDNLNQFLYYCCPECEFQDHSLENFIEHASNKHPKSIECLKKFSSSVVNQNAKKRKNEEESVARNVSEKRMIVNIKVEDSNLSDPNDPEPFQVSENQIESENVVLCQNDTITIKEEPKEVLSDFNNHEIENQIGDTIGVESSFSIADEEDPLNVKLEPTDPLVCLPNPNLEPTDPNLEPNQVRPNTNANKNLNTTNQINKKFEREHQSTKTYKCKCGICGKIMNSSEELKLHVYLDHKVRSTGIDYGNSSSSNRPVIESTIDYTSEVHVCYRCNRIFKNIDLLNQHNEETCRRTRLTSHISQIPNTNSVESGCSIADEEDPLNVKTKQLKLQPNQVRPNTNVNKNLNPLKRPKLVFPQKVQELVLLRVKENYEPLYHDMSMKNTPENKKAAWQNLTDYANELLEKEKPGCYKVQDIAQMKVIVNTSWRGPVKKLLDPLYGNAGPKYRKALTPNQKIIHEIFSKPSMPDHFRLN